jgi:hypothetical protein
MVNYERKENAMKLKPEDVKVNNLGHAKRDSVMFKRGWSVNVTSQKPAPAPKPPASPERKKNSGK